MKRDSDGLICAVIQDSSSGRVLMVGYMDDEALSRTLDSKAVTFWSRSRREYWKKEETSGNFLHLVSAEIDSDDEQLRNGHGYDHNWVLATAGDLSRPAARLVSPVAGIALEVFTDEPGIQVYVGNFLDGTVREKHGIPYAHRTAVCLETQHYPDSPNKPQWPSVVLRPGETYHSRCIYRFSVDK